MTTTHISRYHKLRAHIVRCDSGDEFAIACRGNYGYSLYQTTIDGCEFIGNFPTVGLAHRWIETDQS